MKNLLSSVTVLLVLVSNATGFAASFQGLGDLPGGYFDSYVSGISADGLVAVGQSHSTLGWEAFCWTVSGEMVGLGDLSGGSFYSSAYSVSADGSAVFGQGTSATSTEIFCWTSGGVWSDFVICPMALPQAWFLLIAVNQP